MKLNKQGVRDLNHITKPKPVPDFGKNQLPGELAAKLLTETAATVPFGDALPPEVQEMLTILAEECGEVVQRVTKILRFGMRSNPWNGKDNVQQLETELGDIMAVIAALHALRVIDNDRVDELGMAKVEAFLVEEDPTRPRLRHAGKVLRAILERE